MKTTDQINHFAKDLNRLVDRYATEYDLPLAAVIGTLEIKKQDLINEHDDDSE